MPSVVRGYDLAEDIKARAERLRQQELEGSVLGLIRADRIEANSIVLGIGGNVAVAPGALDLADDDSLIGIPAGSFTAGHAASLMDFPPGVFSVGNEVDVPGGSLTLGAEVLIPDSIITNTKLAPDSVTTSKISANAVGANEIAANAIIAGKIATGAVTTGKLDAGAVTAAKMNVGTLSAISAALGTITDVTSLDTRPGLPHLHLDRDEMIVRNESDDRVMHIDWGGADAAVVLDMGFRKTWDFVPGITFTDLGATPDYLFGHVIGFWETDSPARYVMSMKVLDSSFIWVEGGGHGVTVGRGSGASAFNYVIDASGEMWSDAYRIWSDERAKDKIRPLESRRNDVRKLRPIRFRAKDTGVERIGFSAQEVAAVFPELAKAAPAPSRRDMEPLEYDRMGIDAGGLLATVIQSVQELSDEVDKLKKAK